MPKKDVPDLVARAPYTSKGIFTAREVVSLTGVRYPMVDYLHSRGYASATIGERVVGSGNRRFYSLQDIVTVRLAAKLLKQGISGNTLKRAVHAARANEGGPLVLDLSDELREAETFVGSGLVGC